MGRPIDVMKHASVLLLAITCAAAARADEPAWVLEVSERVLATAPRFETAAVGEGGDAPATAIAYRHVLRRPDAAQVFERLLAARRPAARLYGVVGLRHAAPDRFEPAARELLGASSAEEVQTFEGCCIEDTTVARVVPRIQAGEWDRLREAEAPPEGTGVRALVDALISGDGDEDRAEEVARQLAALGPVAVIPELPRALAHERPQVRARALRAAQRLSPWLGDLLPHVVKGLSDPDEDAREFAAYALCQAASPVPAAEAALLQVLRAKDADPSARAAVLAAVGECAMNDVTFDAVAALLQHADPDVREEARYALRNVVDEHPDARLRARAVALVGE